MKGRHSDEHVCTYWRARCILERTLAGLLHGAHDGGAYAEKMTNWDWTIIESVAVLDSTCCLRH